jgi:hypothetical protein
MGSDATPNGLRFQFADRFKPIAKRQLDALACGADPKDVDLSTVGKGNNGQKSWLCFLVSFSMFSLLQNPLNQMLMIQEYPSTSDKTPRLEESSSSFALSRPMPSVRRLVQMLVAIPRCYALAVRRAFLVL